MDDETRRGCDHGGSRMKLARRAVASGGWKWLDGSAWVNADADDDSLTFEKLRDGESTVWPRFGRFIDGEFIDGEDGADCRPGEPLPDLDDPATLGCFEHGLLPACGYHEAHIDVAADREGRALYYVVYRPDPISFPTKWLSADDEPSYTKSEALVRALEAAPSRDR